MNLDKLKKSFKAFTKSAQNLVKDKEKTMRTVQESITKSTANKGALTQIWEQMQLLFSIAKDYANGSYTDIPKGSIVAIVAGLLYFISPLDLIPDFIAVFGFIDDAFVLSLVYKQVAKDLEKYQIWKDKQNVIEI